MFVAVKRFRASIDYDTKLSKYVAAAYIECIGNMIRLMIERGIKAVVLVLTKGKNLYDPTTSPFRITRVELPEISLITCKD